MPVNNAKVRKINIFQSSRCCLFRLVTTAERVFPIILILFFQLILTSIRRVLWERFWLAKRNFRFDYFENAVGLVNKWRNICSSMSGGDQSCKLPWTRKFSEHREVSWDFATSSCRNRIQLNSIFRKFLKASIFDRPRFLKSFQKL